MSGPWSAFREWFPGDSGYGKLRIVNSTHIYWEQIKAYDGSVTDSIWISQEHHGPFKPLDVEYWTSRSERLQNAMACDLNKLRNTSIPCFKYVWALDLHFNISMTLGAEQFVMNNEISPTSFRALFVFLMGEFRFWSDPVFFLYSI